MFTYAIVICVIGWIIRKITVQICPKWLGIFPTILLTWMATLAVGFGIEAFEIDAEDAARRMAGA